MLELCLSLLNTKNVIFLNFILISKAFILYWESLDLGLKIILQTSYSI